MSDSEQRMNNTQSENGANTSEQRWDLGTLFPAKGDPRKPPEWLGRALLYIAIAIVGFTFCWRSWGKIEYLVIDIIVSLFIALAVEPVVVPLVKHGLETFVRVAVLAADAGRDARRAVHTVRQPVRAADDRLGERSARPGMSRCASSPVNTRISSFLRSIISAMRF